jgi:N-acyl homoserine lactone hydrolase
MIIDVLLPGFPGKADRGFLGWCNVLILKIPGSLTVIDTGSYGDRQMLLASLAEQGVKPESVDKVLITHLHFDHCLNADVFPRAEILIGATEWEYANSGLPQMNNDVFVPKTLLPYLASRRPTLVKEGHYLSEGSKIVELPGHTPGCIGLLCETEGLLVAGDAVKNARDFHFGDPGMCFDSQANGIASLKRAAKLANTIFPGHDSQFSTIHEKILKHPVPEVVLTDFVDWENRIGTTHALPRR